MLSLEALQALPVTTGRPDDLQQLVLRFYQIVVPRFAGCQCLRAVVATAILTEFFLGLQSAEGMRPKWQFCRVSQGVSDRSAPPLQQRPDWYRLR